MTIAAADRLDILDLVALADDRATHRDVDGYLALVTDDVLLDGGQETHRGHAALRQALPAVWGAEPSGSRHLSTTVSVRAGERPDEATVHATLLIASGEPPAIHAVVEVEQEVRKADGRWLIARRTLRANAPAASVTSPQPQPQPESQPQPHPQSPPRADDSAAALSDRPLAFYNALLTEHFVLESARGVTVSESSSRASLYLMTLSSALVAFGFLASTPYAFGFLGVIIPVVFLLGVFTYERLVQTSLEDVAALASIQRIRAYYSTLLPGAERYFPIPGGAVPNELLEIGQRGYRRGVFFTISSAIGVVNSVLAGAGCALLAYLVTASFAAALAIGVACAIILVVVHGAYQEMRYGRYRREAGGR